MVGVSIMEPGVARDAADATDPQESKARRGGCHAFAAGLQRERTLSDHGESMRSLQGAHAFAVIPHGILRRARAAKAWHPKRFHLLTINKLAGATVPARVARSPERA